MHLAILFQQLHGESTAQRMSRQRDNADFIMFGDARGLTHGAKMWGGCWLITPKGTINEQQGEILSIMITMNTMHYMNIHLSTKNSTLPFCK